jgi:Flp pilus assembly protein TadG
MFTKWIPSFMDKQRSASNEAGQSIVIIAFILIGLLAFAGIAVDVGFVFTRSAQLQAAVDAAVLAGVTELSSGTLADADNRAAQFLRANGVPISVTQTFLSSTDKTELQATEYTITATWPVDLFFLRVIGQERVGVTRAATAAYFPLADIYTSRRAQYGFVDTANQSIFGPQICTRFGDPFSPYNSQWHPNDTYTWQYRIYIPRDYPHNIVRVEIFDPDSINKPDNTVRVFFSQFARQADPVKFPDEGKEMSCKSLPNDPYSQSFHYQPCVIETGELDLLQDFEDLTIDHVNPYWFVRIDENRGGGPEHGHGDGSCSMPGAPEPFEYIPGYNTQTIYELFYYSQGADGRIDRNQLAAYYGQVGDNIRDTGNHQTDLRWVSPGATQPSDYPIDPNAVQTLFGSFEVDLTQYDILEDPGSGARYLYLDITSISGASENGFQLWAGPPTDYASDVNVRNIRLVDQPGEHYSDGVMVYAMGHLPMNSIYDSPIDIPLLFIGPEQAGQSVYVSLFDPDAGTQPPIAFFLDSLAFTSDPDQVNMDKSKTDWGHLFGDATDPNDADRCFHVDKVGANGEPDNRCTNQWVTPSYGLKIPGDMSNCDYAYLQSNPNDFEYRRDYCTPFYGGILYSRYASAFSDTYVWEIRVSGIPWLVR